MDKGLNAIISQILLKPVSVRGTDDEEVEDLGSGERGALRVER